MARCLIAGQHAFRDSRGTDLHLCEYVHCAGFCSCDSNTGPDNPRNFETEPESNHVHISHKE
jgi:hypothetical protein